MYVYVCKRVCVYTYEYFYTYLPAFSFLSVVGGALCTYGGIPMCPRVCPSGYVLIKRLSTPPLLNQPSTKGWERAVTSARRVLPDEGAGAVEKFSHTRETQLQVRKVLLTWQYLLLPEGP